jgi:hypothetical protein
LATVCGVSEEVRLGVAAGTLERSGSSGAIWGEVWLEAGGLTFPGEDWNDLVVVVVREFLAATRALTPSRHGRQKVQFFDGPYSVTLQLREDAELAVTLESRHSGDVSRTVTAGWPGWVASACAAARELLDACDRNGWADLEDVDLLRRQLAAMETGVWRG